MQKRESAKVCKSRQNGRKLIQKGKGNQIAEKLHAEINMGIYFLFSCPESTPADCLPANLCVWVKMILCLYGEEMLLFP